MKKIILICAIFLIIPLAIAEEITLKNIYAGTPKDGSYFAADGKQWYIKALSLSKIKIVYPGGVSQIIGINESAVQEGYQVTLIEIKSGEDFSYTASNYADYFNITTQQWKMFPNIRIDKMDSSFELTRELDKTEVLVNEEIRVSVTVENTGSKQIDKASYIEEFPKGVIITSVQDCSIVGNSVVWEGSPTFEGTTFYYSFTSKNPINLTTKGTLTVGSEDITKTTDVKITAPVLEVDTMITKEKLEIGETSTIVTSLINHDPDYQIAPLTYKIYFPDGLKLINKTGSTQQQLNYWLHDEYLPAQENNTITYTVKAEKIGNFTIKEVVDYKVINIQHKLERSHNIEVFAKSINFILSSKEIKRGESTNIQVKIANPGEYTYKNVEIGVNTNLPIEQKKSVFEKIEPHETKDAFNLAVTVPENITDPYLEIFTKFSTIYGDTITRRESINILNSSFTQNLENPQVFEEIVANATQIQEDTKKETTDYLMWGIGIAIIIAVSIILIIIFRGRKSVDKKIELLEK